MAELTYESTSRTVKTERWKIHYHEAGSGPVLILLHGSAPGSSGWSNFGRNMAALSRDFRVIVPDQPGWGETDTNDSRTESRDVLNALSVRLLMDELGVDKAALVGNSMGGATTQYFAIAYPDRISHFITMGAGRGGPSIAIPGGQPNDVARIGIQAYSDPSWENIKRSCLSMVYDPKFVTDEVVDVRAKSAADHPEHIANYLANVPHFTAEEMLTNLAKLSKLKVPALLMHGRDDRVVPCEHSIRVASVIPNARLLIFSQCGHWVQIEREAEFNAAVDCFVKLNA